MLSHVSIRDLSSGRSFDKAVKVQVGVNLKLLALSEALDLSYVSKLRPPPARFTVLLHCTPQYRLKPQMMGF